MPLRAIAHSQIAYALLRRRPIFRATLQIIRELRHSGKNLRRGSRGLTTIPDRKSDALIQSSGQRWRIFREQSLPRYGIWGLSGICVILALFFMIRGPILIETGFSGISILRFRSIERFAHWLLSLSFLVLAVTGLNMLYGSDVIKPLVGYIAFAKVTAYGKWLHDFTGYAFIAGLMLALFVWIRDNIPNRGDLHWLARAGGLFSRGLHPPTHRFNAGSEDHFLVCHSGRGVNELFGNLPALPVYLQSVR